MIVSIAIFTVVAVIAIGALLKIVDANRKSQTLETSIDNIDFALDAMTRELRTGSDYNCSQDTVPPSSSIIFPVTLTKSTSCDYTGNTPWIIEFTSAIPGPGGACDLIHAFRYNPSATTGELEKAEQTTCGVETDPWSAVISPDVIMTSADIHLLTGVSDTQSWVRFQLVGYAGVRAQDQSYFDVQTGVSQRISD